MKGQSMSKAKKRKKKKEEKNLTFGEARLKFIREQKAKAK
jgi:hypothetical protein